MELMNHTDRLTTKNIQEDAVVRVLRYIEEYYQAAYYLRCTTLKVDDIGRAVGYSNLSYFHRIFKEAYGLTPKKYRDAQG